MHTSLNTRTVVIDSRASSDKWFEKQNPVPLFPLQILQEKNNLTTGFIINSG